MGVRSLALAGIGGLAVVVGLALVAAGLLVALQTQCAPTYEATVQPVDGPVDGDVVAYEDLSTPEQRAFDAAREGEDRSYSRSAVSTLEDAVVEKDGERYATDLVRAGCAEPGTWLYLGGGGLAVVGATAALLAVAHHRLA